MTTGTDTPTQELLRSAWDDLFAALSQARDALEDPELYAPPHDDRLLAEGYRYLLGYLYGAIERATIDPRFTFFRRAIQPLDKATIDNADALYLHAPIDGNETYVVTARPHVGWKTPQYVIVEVCRGYAGDTGKLEELFNGTRAGTGSMDSAAFETAADGSFEILLAPERPAGHSGNFIPTVAARDDGTVVADQIILRELFHDWEHEDNLELEITCLSSHGHPPAALDAARMAAQLGRVGEIVRNQTLFWNEFYTVLLETHGDRNGDGKRFMPLNAFNEPMLSTMAIGGVRGTNVYAGAVYDLAPDEALVICNRVPVEPSFHGIHLSNLWGESHDYANHQSSLNAFQSQWDDDGAVRWVVAHSDPGVPNWLDTTGVRSGFISPRWSYSQAPAELPTIVATKVPLSEVRDHLPAGTPSVSADERAAHIRMRQAHVQRRFRQY